WRVSLVAETLGASSGVGYRLRQASDLIQIDQVFAWTIVQVAMMLVIEIGVLAPLERPLFPWGRGGRGGSGRGGEAGRPRARSLISWRGIAAQSHKPEREDDVRNSRLRRSIACAAAVGALLACASGADAQTTVKIGLAVPNYGPFAPVYAAEELGYYKEAGVTAEITAYRGGPAAQEALAAGAADFINFFPPGVALAVKKGIKEKVVGIGSAKPYGWHLVVMASSPYRTVADLAGKRIGIT